MWLEPIFDHACNYSLPLLTLRELRMLQFMNEVTDKQDWQKKVGIGPIQIE